MFISIKKNILLLFLLFIGSLQSRDLLICDYIREIDVEKCQTFLQDNKLTSVEKDYSLELVQKVIQEYKNQQYNFAEYIFSRGFLIERIGDLCIYFIYNNFDSNGNWYEYFKNSFKVGLALEICYYGRKLHYNKINALQRKIYQAELIKDLVSNSETLST